MPTYFLSIMPADYRAVINDGPFSLISGAIPITPEVCWRSSDTFWVRFLTTKNSNFARQFEESFPMHILSYIVSPANVKPPTMYSDFGI
jgi:hypothetical protein